jgi:NAD(P)-dependent dehydrogenase (short-subunit alcohol dehydrogenase family)
MPSAAPSAGRRQPVVPPAVAVAPPAVAAAPGRFSIKREFAGASVFITGATGYVGGLVLESLLRTTDVGRVYVLLRAKKNQAVSERAAKLLQGAMFHLVREKPALLSKVTAVAGDLGQPGLGLSPEDLRALAGSVDILIHSAADIRLEAPIQETMRANYVGTQRVLQLALQLPRCGAGPAAVRSRLRCRLPAPAVGLIPVPPQPRQCH